MSSKKLTITVAYRNDGLFLFYFLGIDHSEQEKEFSKKIAGEISHCLKIKLGHRHIFHTSPRLGQSETSWRDWSARERRQILLRRQPILCTTPKELSERANSGTSDTKKNDIQEYLGDLALDEKRLVEIEADSQSELLNWPNVPAISKLRESFAKIFDRVFEVKSTQRQSIALSLTCPVAIYTFTLAIYLPILISHSATVEGENWIVEPKRFFGAIANPLIGIVIIAGIFFANTTKKFRNAWSHAMSKIESIPFIKADVLHRWVLDRGIPGISRWTFRYLIWPVFFLVTFIYLSFEESFNMIDAGHKLSSIMTSYFSFDFGQFSRPSFSLDDIRLVFITHVYWSFLAVMFVGMFYVWWFLSFDYHRRYRKILKDTKGMILFANIYSDVVQNLYKHADHNLANLEKINFSNAVEIIDEKIASEDEKIHIIESALYYLTIVLAGYTLIFCFFFSFQIDVEQINNCQPTELDNGRVICIGGSETLPVVEFE